MSYIVYKYRKVYIFLCYTLYFYTFYNIYFLYEIKLHCRCVSKNCVNYQIPAISRKPCHLSCAIISPQDTRRDQPREAAPARRTLQQQIFRDSPRANTLRD